MKIHNQEIKKYIRDMVHHYCEYDEREHEYYIDISKLPEFYFFELASMFIQDEDFASESMGADNENFLKSMLPAFVVYLKDSCNSQKRNDFADSYRYGVTDYFKKQIEDLIQEEIETYNQEMQENHHHKEHDYDEYRIF